MKLEDQVVSLELAKKLKALNLKQKSLFYWTEYMDGAEVDFRIEQKLIPPSVCSAFSIAELGNLLIKGKHNFMPYFCDQPAEMCWVYNFGGTLDTVTADTEADARAKCLVYLLEHNLIKTNDIQ